MSAYGCEVSNGPHDNGTRANGKVNGKSEDFIQKLQVRSNKIL